MAAPISLRLAVRQWMARPLRPILCSIAIAAAVALIVCTGAAFDSIRYSLNAAIGQMLGVADAHVRAAQRGTETRVPDSVLEKIRARPEVAFADGRLQGHAALTKGEEHRWFDVVGIDPKLDEKLRPKVYLAGHAMEPGKPDEIAVDNAVAGLMKVKVGDEVTYTADGVHKRQVEVVGIVKRPSIELIAKPTFYVELGALAKDMRMSPPEYDVVDVKVKDSAGVTDYDKYAKELQKALNEGGGPSVKVAPGMNSKARLSNETRSIRFLLMLLATISGLCAALIIGTTLSVGVQERVRQFGQLRCLGASRGQLVMFLLGDAVVMMGIGEVLGIGLGFVLSWGLVWWFPQFFLAYRIEFSSIVIAMVNGCVATLAGAAIPMWQVTRVSPMAAVTSVARKSNPRSVVTAAAVGVVCLAVQIALWNLTASKNFKFYSYMFGGIPLVFLGWALLGPMILVVVEAGAARVLGALFGLRKGGAVLLRSAWSRTPWRTGAMISALMIGVTLFVAVWARGQSLLASWTAPARFPDLFLYSIAPITPARLDMLKKGHPEITAETTLAAFPVKMKPQAIKNGEVLPGANTTFVAVDPGSFAQLVEMEYLQGDPKTAVKELEDGKHIFVTKEFYSLHGMGVGDKLAFVGADGKPVEFTIAAVVTSTGMDLVKNYFDIRTAFQEAAVTSVLGSLSDAKTYFRLRDVNMMLLNLDAQHANPTYMAGLRQQLLEDGYQSASSVEVKTGLKGIIMRVVKSLSVIAVGALLLASLGVANMVIASVHARRFEFGVLRAIGAGRFQLVRLVLAEVTLVGVVAGGLGSAAGLWFAYMATRIDKLVVGFRTNFLSTNVTDTVVIGVSLVGAAVVITMVLAWIAAVLPAVRGARAAQRTLLAGGRA